VDFKNMDPTSRQPFRFHSKMILI